MSRQRYTEEFKIEAVERHVRGKWVCDRARRRPTGPTSRPIPLRLLEGRTGTASDTEGQPGPRTPASELAAQRLIIDKR